MAQPPPSPGGAEGEGGRRRGCELSILLFETELNKRGGSSPFVNRGNENYSWLLQLCHNQTIGNCVSACVRTHKFYHAVRYIKLK